jgi:DNA replication protein DnaC
MSHCELCHGKGFTIRFNSETKEDTAYPCECWLKRDEESYRKNMLVKAHIPQKYWDYSLENYQSCPLENSDIKEANRPSVEKMDEFIKDPKKFLSNYSVLWIWGKQPNAGHTALAIMLARELLNLKNRRRVRFIRMQELLSEFTNFEEKKEFFKNFEKFDIYLLDDAFDTTRCIASGEYTRIHLYNWLNSVISNKKYLICTSKIPITQIDVQFEQSKNLLLKPGVPCSLEFQGTIQRVGGK